MPVISSAVLAASRSSRRSGDQTFGGKLEDDMFGVTTQQNGGNPYQQANSLLQTLERNIFVIFSTSFHSLACAGTLVSRKYLLYCRINNKIQNG